MQINTKINKSSRVKRLILTAGLLLTAAALPLSAYSNATVAGTLILATNTELTYQATGGGSTITNYSTLTNGAETNIIVQTIFGFSNTSGTNYNALVYSNAAGITNFYYFASRNEGNTNVTNMFSFSWKEIVNYDGDQPSNWTMQAVSATNIAAPPLLWTGADDPFKNFAANPTGGLGTAAAETVFASNLQFWMLVAAPSGAKDGTGYEITVSNLINTGAITPDFYTGSNSYSYGGTNSLVMVFSNVISAPNIYFEKSLTIVNPHSNANGLASDAVAPGSHVTYRIDYTNKGSAPGLNLAFAEILPNSAGTRYVDFLTGSITATNNSVQNTFNTYTDIDADFGSGLAANNNTSGDPVSDINEPSSGNVNTNVSQINFKLPSLGPQQSGFLEYTVVVR